MDSSENEKNRASEVHHQHETEKFAAGKDNSRGAFEEFERGVYAAIETYSNVHRGSGHNSMVSTHLFEQARDIVLEYLALDKGRHVVIFCTPRRAEVLIKKIKPENYHLVSSEDIGLSLAIRALAVRKKALPKGIPFQTGGGTTKLISRSWVIWADLPAKLEAGTPAIINVIAFALALRLVQKYGNEVFQGLAAEELTAQKILYHDELEEYSGKELLHQLRNKLIGSSIRVPTVDGARRYINLDNSASTPTFTPIWKAFLQTLHQPAQIQQEIIREVKSVCADALSAPPSGYDVIFTSNTTEAINLMAESLSHESIEDIEPVVLNTLLEHSSNDLPWRNVPSCSLIRLSVDNEGFVDLKELDTILCRYNHDGQHGKKRIRLVAVSGASNVLGVCNNISEISRIVRKYGARILVDAAQLAAHRRIDIEAWGIDYLAFSAHKVYAPFGCGVLVVRKGLLDFDSSELKLIQSSGEENPGGIAALGKALLLIQRIGMDHIQDEEQELTRRALHGLSKITGLKMYGITDPDSPRFDHKIGVIVFSLKDKMSNKVAIELAERGGIGVRYGCHCAHIIIKHILNIGLLLEQFQGLILTLFPRLTLPGLVRVSLGIGNNEEDVDALIRVMSLIAGQPYTKGMQNLSRTEIQKQIGDFVGASALRVYSQP